MSKGKEVKRQLVKIISDYDVDFLQSAVNDFIKTHEVIKKECLTGSASTNKTGLINKHENNYKEKVIILTYIQKIKLPKGFSKKEYKKYAKEVAILNKDLFNEWHRKKCWNKRNQEGFRKFVADLFDIMKGEDW